MIILKDSSVIHEGLVPEMHYGLGVAAALKYRLFGLNCVVTALLDGVHNPGSLHPLGRAADLRARDLREDEAISWYEAIKQELEPMGFDCVWEGGVGATPVTTGAHVHLEFQPKAGESFWHLANQVNMDKPFRVTWVAGQIVVHAPSHARAIDVALEYIRQPQTSRILVEPAESEIITK